jgi:hypothetical protein
VEKINDHEIVFTVEVGKAVSVFAVWLLRRKVRSQSG